MRQKMQQTTIKLAGLEDMPPELICLLEPHLELRDVLSCQLVSKAWSGAWSQDGVAYQVCNRYFPGLMEMHPFEAFGRLLVDALNKRRREHSSKRLIRWNTNWETPIFQNPSRRPRSIPLDTGSEHSQQYPIRYVDGKMAWQPRRDLVIVDDLNTKIRQRVVCPRLEPPLRYQLVALSSQLVVFFTIDQEHETHVVPVYHLEHRQFKKIHLPSPVAQCCVDGDRVGAVTKTGQIIVWTWNGKSTQLDLEGVSTPPDSSPHLVPGLFFHPRDGTVFAVWFYGYAQPNRRFCTLVLGKFKDARIVWQSSTSIANPMADYEHTPSYSNDCALISFKPQKADNNGSYTLAIYRIQNKYHSRNALCQCFKGWKIGDWGTVTFNTLTSAFSHHFYDWTGQDLIWDPNKEYEYRGTAPYNLLMDMHLWNGRLLLTMDHRFGESSLKLYLCALNPNGSEPSERPVVADERELNRFIGPLLQDDERVVFPTRRNLLLFEYSEQLSDACEELEDTPEELPEYVQQRSHVLIELKHGRRAHLRLEYQVYRMPDIDQAQHSEVREPARMTHVTGGFAPAFAPGFSSRFAPEQYAPGFAPEIFRPPF